MRLLNLILLVILTPALSSTSAQETAGQFILYLEKLNPSGIQANLTFETVTLEGQETGQELRLVTRNVNADELTRHQVLLAETMLEAGDYHRISLTVRLEVVSSGSDTRVDSVFRQDVALPLNLTIPPGGCATLFLKTAFVTTGDSASVPEFRAHEVRKRIPPVTSLAYVTNEASHNISILDRAAGEVVGCIPAGRSPRGMALSRIRNLLFVANSESNTISVIETRTGQRREDIHLDFGDEPEALCLTNDERYLISANRGSNSATLIDLFSFSVVRKVAVGNSPVDAAADPRTPMVYVVNSLSDNVTVFNVVNPLDVTEIPVGSTPVSITFDKREPRAYVANHHSGYISVINTDSRSAAEQLNSARSACDIVVDSFSGVLYYAVQNQNQIAVLKPSLNIDISEIRVDAYPFRASLNPEGSRLYVTCREANTVNVINKTRRRLEYTIGAGRRPHTIIFP